MTFLILSLEHSGQLRCVFSHGKRIWPSQCLYVSNCCLRLFCDALRQRRYGYRFVPNYIVIFSAEVEFERCLHLRACEMAFFCVSPVDWERVFASTSHVLRGRGDWTLGEPLLVLGERAAFHRIAVVTTCAKEGTVDGYVRCCCRFCNAKERNRCEHVATAVEFGMRVLHTFMCCEPPGFSNKPGAADQHSVSRDFDIHDDFESGLFLFAYFGVLFPYLFLNR